MRDGRRLRRGLEDPIGSLQPFVGVKGPHINEAYLLSAEHTVRELMTFCPQCGEKNDSQVESCRFCGAKIPKVGTQPPRGTSAVRLPRPKHTPLPPFGIAVIAAVESVLGALYTSVGITRIVTGGWLTILQLVVGIAFLAAGWGLWDLKKWAWNLAIASAVADILVHLRYYLIHAVLPPTMIATVIFDMTAPAYLVIPKTRAYFSKGMEPK